MYVYPESPETPTCALVLVPIELVPIVGALFGQMESRRQWVTESDWQQGYKAFVELQRQLMNNCIDNLIKEQQRTYRLLETVFYGTEWTATEVDGETVITPELPDIPPSIAHLGSVKARLERMEVLLDNFFNGVTYPDWELEDDESARALLTGVINRLKAGDPEGDAILELIREKLL